MTVVQWKAWCGPVTEVLWRVEPNSKWYIYQQAFLGTAELFCTSTNLIDWSFVILGSYLSFIGMKQIIKKYILIKFISLRNVQLHLCRRYKFTVHCIYILNEWLGDFHQSFCSDLDHYFWLRNVTLKEFNYLPYMKCRFFFGFVLFFLNLTHLAYFNDLNYVSPICNLS